MYAGFVFLSLLTKTLQCASVTGLPLFVANGLRGLSPPQCIWASGSLAPLTKIQYSWVTGAFLFNVTGLRGAFFDPM